MRVLSLRGTHKLITLDNADPVLYPQSVCDVTALGAVYMFIRRWDYYRKMEYRGRKSFNPPKIKNEKKDLYQNYEVSK